MERMKELKVSYKGILKDVRGKGMMVGMELKDL